MNANNHDKKFGIALFAALSCSFIVTSDVSAAQTFPPQHLARDANFNENGERTSTRIPGPYYRPEAGRPAVTFNAAAVASNPRYVFVERPWYRATN